MKPDLRTFLAHLRTERPGEIADVTTPVLPDQEAISLVRYAETAGRHPVFRFSAIRGWSGTVVTNVHASRETGFLLGCTGPRRSSHACASQTSCSAPPT